MIFFFFHSSGFFLGKLFRPKTSLAARALTMMYTPAFVMLVERPDGSQYVWVRCNVATLGEQGSLGYCKPKSLPKLSVPKDHRWTNAYMAMRWSGYEEKDLDLMRAIARLNLRLFKHNKPELSMTALLVTVLHGAVPHLQRPATEAAPLEAAPYAAMPAHPSTSTPAGPSTAAVHQSTICQSAAPAAAEVDMMRCMHRRRS